MTGREPMEEGKLAALNGDPRNSNPYPDGSDEAERWLTGYDHVIHSDDEGEPMDNEDV